MPGKINPVIPEVVNQIAFKVIGNDITVTMAAEAGQLELNVMEPIIAYSLFQSINIISNGCYTLADKCFNGIIANIEKCREFVDNSIGIITVLVPFLGYEVCSTIAKQAFETGKSVRTILLEQGHITQNELDEMLKPENMIHPIPFKMKVM